MPRKLRKPWLLSYLDYVEDFSGPSQYKFWSAVAAISSTLKNNVWINYANYKIYPNQYIILIGAPGIGKGTSINPSVNIVKKSGTANYLSDRMTAEKVLQTLEAGFAGQLVQQPANNTGPVKILQTVGDKSCTILSTELPVFLSSSDWMIPLMCELWEKGEFNYATKNKGTISASGLCVSLLGACVPDYIRNLSKDSTAFITSGFSSRCIFVFASDRGKLVAWPEFDTSKQKLEDDLAEDLKYIGQIKDQFKLSVDARLYWEEFFNSLKPDEFESDVVTNFKARMISHVLKLSMVLSVSEKDDRIITKDNLFNAVSKINEVRSNLDVAFRSIGESSLAGAQDRIIRYIQAKGITTRSEILRNNMRHITVDDLDRVLHVLELTNYIIIKTKGTRMDITSTDKNYRAKGATP